MKPPEQLGTPTHDVTNQPPALCAYNLLEASAVLAQTLDAFGASGGRRKLHDLGALAGSAEAIGWGYDANRNPPILRAFDRFGHRLDEVEYHPSYHKLMEVAVAHGLHASSWCDPVPGAHVTRAAAFSSGAKSTPGTDVRSR
jgi:putative acyl-CoA dehydrogenase